MKRLVYLFSFLCSLNLSAQVEVHNEILNDQSEKLAFRGQANSLAITGIELDSTSQLISSSETIKISRNNRFYYRPFKRQEQDTLSLYIQNKFIAQFIFRLENLRDVSIYYGSVRDTIITKDELLSNPGLIATYEPQNAKCDISIRSFNASILKPNGKEIDITEDENYKWIDWSEKRVQRKIKRRGTPLYGGSKFTNSQLNKLRKVKSGDIIWFKSVVMISPDAMGRAKIINLKLKVVD